MKSRRFQYEYRENASSLHKKVGEVLRQSSLFSCHKVYQEYPVYLINSGYFNKRHRFDWVILDLAIVIEVHGQQHDTSVVHWGGLDGLSNVQMRDRLKRDAAVEAGFTYLEISYRDIENLDEQFLYNLWQEHKNSDKIVQTEEEQPFKKICKQKRREFYQRMKQGKEVDDF